MFHKQFELSSQSVLVKQKFLTLNASEGATFRWLISEQRWDIQSNLFQKITFLCSEIFILHSFLSSVRFFKILERIFLRIYSDSNLWNVLQKFRFQISNQSGIHSHWSLIQPTVKDSQLFAGQKAIRELPLCRKAFKVKWCFHHYCANPLLNEGGINIHSFSASKISSFYHSSVQFLRNVSMQTVSLVICPQYIQSFYLNVYLKI